MRVELNSHEIQDVDR